MKFIVNDRNQYFTEIEFRPKLKFPTERPKPNFGNNKYNFILIITDSCIKLILFFNYLDKVICI